MTVDNTTPVLHVGVITSESNFMWERHLAATRRNDNERSFGIESAPKCPVHKRS